jgi:hypothetical protein
MRSQLRSLALGALVLGASPAARAGLYLTELLALNATGLTDEDGEHSDWIEIFNDEAGDVDVDGWYLTDDATALTKWRFPPTVVPAGGRLVVFASDKNRAASGSELHTNFKLGGGGEYLGLVRADGVTIEHEYAPAFPPQTADVSWGLALDLSQQRCFLDPTPGAANDESPPCGVVEKPAFSVARGFYDAPFSVAISTPTPGALIYHTLDGSDPSPTNGTLYTGPIPITTTATLRAAAYAPPLLPTPSVTHTYLFLQDVIHQTGAGFPTEGFPADYAMDPKVVNDPRYSPTILDDLRAVPTISIVMDVDDLFGQENGIYVHPDRRGPEWERPASAELILPDGSTGFQVNSGVRIQGRTSRARNPKKSLRLSFKSIFGPAHLEYPLFADTPVTRFDKLRLRASHNKSWSFGIQRADYIRDQWMRDTQIAMGRIASHGAFFHLYLNGLYWGLYNVVELPEAEFAVAYFGGTEDEWDVIKPDETDSGTRDAWEMAHDLAAAGLATPAAYAEIRQYVDVPNLIDYMIANIHGGTDNWDGTNWYAARRRLPGEGFRFFSWDAESSMESLQKNCTGISNLGKPSGLYAALRANEEFRVLFGDHVHRHFFNGGGLTPPVAAARYMERVAEIDRAIVPESARWGDTTKQSDPFDRDTDWVPEIEWLRLYYFPQRSAVVLQQFRDAGLYPAVEAPAFHQHGGFLAAGAAVAISAPSGTIYYTLDGSDPRLEGGAVAPAATIYATPIALTGTTAVRARVLAGGAWSALNEATFVPDVPLRVTELMYHPTDPPPASPWEDDDFEFAELTNVGGLPIVLTGARVTGGIGFTFGSGTLGPGGHVLIVRNQVAFESRYGSGKPIAGQYTGKLANEGERVRLETAAGDEILDFTYDDAWYPQTDGGGRSLVIANAAAERSAWSRADGWRASTFADGSAGAPELPLCSDGVDNDGDALADLGADPGCGAAAQDEEDPACNDGADDDGDGAADLADPHCASASDDDEDAPPIDAFVCYSALPSAGGPSFGSQTVTLDDEYEGARAFLVRSPRALCVPAVVGEEGIVLDASTHLESFDVRAASVAASPGENGVFLQALGPIFLDALRADRLLAPAAVDEGGPVAPPADSGHALDRYKCYRAKPADDLPRYFPPHVRLVAADAFESGAYDFKKPSRLCNPASVDGSSLKNTAGRLICYQARLARGQARHQPRRGLHVATSFGPTRLDTRRVEEICVPAH